MTWIAIAAIVSFVLVPMGLEMREDIKRGKQ